MKAIQFHQTGSFDELKYEEVDTPTPSKEQVLVKVASASVNYADVMMRRGIYPTMPPLPAIPGIDCSGVVESVGENVTTLQPGQHVTVFGERCYAEYLVADSAVVTPISEEVDLDDAAVLPVNYLTAYHMLHTMAKIEAGQTILVYAAAGGVGTALTQLAKLADARVIGLTSSEEKAKCAKQQGADDTINYKSEDVAKRIIGITDEKGVDVIFNSVAGDTFKRDLEVIAPLGQIIWYGYAAGLPQENFVELLTTNFAKNLAIKTFVIYGILALSPNMLSQSMEVLIKHLTEKKIRPHIYARMPLSEAAKAHELLETGAVTGKLILKP